MSYLTMLLGQQQSQIIELLEQQQQQQREPQQKRTERQPAGKTPVALRVLRVTLLLVVVISVLGIWVLLPAVFMGNLRYILALPVVFLLTLSGKPALSKAPTTTPFRRF